METAITTIGTITEQLSPNTYRVALPNGKIVFGHLSKELNQDPKGPPPFALKSRVHLELTPFDFEKARITALAKD